MRQYLRRRVTQLAVREVFCHIFNKASDCSAAVAIRT